MAITLVGTATGTTTATPPAHQAGDLFLVFAYRDGSLTAPTLASGFTSVNTSSGNTNSFRVGRKFAASSSETVGTWTNATSLILIVLRGVNTSTPTGGTNTSTGSSTTITYNSLTLVNAAGSSWAIAFAGHRSTDVAINTVPSGMTLANSVSDATDEAAGFYQAGVTSFTSRTATVGGTASGWISSSIEVRPQPDPVQTNVGVAIDASASISERALVFSRASATSSTSVLRSIATGKLATVTAASNIARWAIMGNTAEVAALAGMMVRKSLGRTVAAAAPSAVSAIASRAYLVALNIASATGVLCRRSVAKTRLAASNGAMLVRRSVSRTLAAASYAVPITFRGIARTAGLSAVATVVSQRAVGAQQRVAASTALAVVRAMSLMLLGGFSAVVAASRVALVTSVAASLGSVGILSALTEAAGYLRGKISAGMAASFERVAGSVEARLADKGVSRPRASASSTVRRVFDGIIKRKR